MEPSEVAKGLADAINADPDEYNAAQQEARAIREGAGVVKASQHEQWIAYSVDDGVEHFDTESEAVACADEWIKECLDGDEWLDSVETIVVAKIVYRTVERRYGEFFNYTLEKSDGTE